MQIIIKDTNLDGVRLITTDRHEEYRGSLGGTYDEEKYHASGLSAKFVYEMVSTSYNNVLRGLHCDRITTKLVQCLWGEVYSVIVNCDEQSPDFGKWQGFVLSAKNCNQLYVPPLFGLSYYVLSDMAVFHYKMSVSHSDSQLTYRWDDPAFHIDWPTDKPILSLRDKTAKLMKER